MTKSSLSKDQVDEILVEINEGTRKYSDIAFEFGVSKQTIRNINYGKHARMAGISYPYKPRQKAKVKSHEEAYPWHVDRTYQIHLPERKYDL
jgi:predicted transcriptional regulator